MCANGVRVCKWSGNVQMLLDLYSTACGRQGPRAGQGGGVGRRDRAAGRVQGREGGRKRAWVRLGERRRRERAAARTWPESSAMARAYSAELRSGTKPCIATNCAFVSMPYGRSTSPP
eukprot:6179591-Pleurochrysis_carterae.AAC.1